MQPKFGESAGHLGSGYEIFIVDDWIAINTTDDQLQIPYSQVIVCTKDDHFFFIAHAHNTAADATVYEIDLNAGVHQQYTLPHNPATILAHIRAISPDARERNPMMLTGDGRIISMAAQAVAVSCIGLTVVALLALGIMALRARLKKRRPTEQHA